MREYSGGVRPSAARVLSAAVAAGLLAGFITSAAVARMSKTSPLCTRGLTTVQVDPRGLLPLTTNPISASATAALRYTRPGDKPEVTEADLATVDQQRGGEAKYDCGTRVWRRTVVVYIRLRALLPSESLSQRVFFVGRFKRGYHVWQVVH